MDVLNDELINIECLNHDGDERASPFELLLWHFCVQAGRAFDTDEVVFQYLPTGDVGDPLEQIEFFVPRDHPRVADIEAFLIKVVRPICEVIAASKLKMDPGHMGLYVYLYRYSGIVGALAFIALARRASGAPLMHLPADLLMRAPSWAFRKIASALIIRRLVVLEKPLRPHLALPARGTSMTGCVPMPVTTASTLALLSALR